MYQIMGRKMAGIILPIRILAAPRRFIPMAMINTPPTADIWLTTSGSRNGLINTAAMVMAPW